MDRSGRIKHEKGLYRIFRIFILLGFIWTSVIGIFYFFATNNQKQAALKLSTTKAYTRYNTDLAYLRWFSMQRGIYVSANDITKPAPGLRKAEKHDSATSSGSTFTLLNHAYMLRQAHEPTDQQEDIIGRIVSLDKYLHVNDLDSWEIEAFKSFEKKAEEYQTISMIDGKEYLRLMKPLYTEKSCLKCHSNEYSEGDLIGAIKVSVPMEPYNKTKTSTILIITAAYSFIWVIGLLVLALTCYLLKKQYNRLIITENQLRFQAKLLDTVEQSIIATDVEGRILYWNPYSEKLYGWQSSNVTGRYLMDVIIPEVDKKNAGKAHKNVRKGNSLSKEINVKNQSGDIFPALLTASPVYNENNEIIGVISIIIDLSEKKKLEAQLQQTQKMEGLGTLAGGIAHDFNNILTPIMLHSQMAMDELPQNNNFQADMNEIFLATKRARDLVKQILTFARKGKDQRIVLHTSPLIKEVIKFLRSTIPATIDIRFENSTKKDTIFAHPTQLNQIVMNLCTNAAQAMKEQGGVIDITLAEEEIKKEKNSRFENLPEGRYLRLTVKDTGTGIPPDIIDKIFEPYFTTKKAGEGTGLGLAIIHGIVKKYEGEISVKSTPGEGTVFTLFFPLVVESVTEREEIKPVIEKGTEHILFVDDEKPAVTVMVKMLLKLGYSVKATTSSLEALEIFRNAPDSFDLLITDMTMPEMTGEKLVKEIKKIRPDIPAILYTGFSDLIEEEEAKLSGIDGFMIKPISIGDAASAIRKVLDKKIAET